MKLAIDPKKFDTKNDPTGKKVEEAMKIALVNILALQKEEEEKKKNSFLK